MLNRKQRAAHLVIGCGEVGSAIIKILKEKVSDVYWTDEDPKVKSILPPENKKIDVLHLCIPYFDSFVSAAKEYIARFKPALVVNHSTSMPGTTSQIGQDNVVHSPVLGQHNDLYRHIKTFAKAVGYDDEKAKLLAERFLKGVFDLAFFKGTSTTETAKLLSLCRFAVNIEMSRYAKQMCDKLNLDYGEVVTRFIDMYNSGHKKVGLTQFVEPQLYPPKGKIGGHCVLAGVEKAEKVLRNPMFDSIILINLMGTGQ
ncbi:MAG: hypothetical protein WC490_03830 [Candidatus Margulisiibacteriota bacterium]